MNLLKFVDCLNLQIVMSYNNILRFSYKYKQLWDYLNFLVRALTSSDLLHKGKSCYNVKVIGGKEDNQKASAVMKTRTRI